MTKKDLIFKYWDKYGLRPKANEYANLFSVKPSQIILQYMTEYLGGYKKIEKKLQEKFLDKTFEINDGCGSYNIKFKFDSIYYLENNKTFYFVCIVSGSMVFIFSEDPNRYSIWDITYDDEDGKNWEVIEEVQNCIADFIRTNSIDAYAIASFTSPISINFRPHIVKKL
jgi:hypothetical protein